jgi:hypothetical protein
MKILQTSQSNELPVTLTDSGTSLIYLHFEDIVDSLTVENDGDEYDSDVEKTLQMQRKQQKMELISTWNH